MIADVGVLRKPLLWTRTVFRNEGQSQ
jgi:hypothetical protein